MDELYNSIFEINLRVLLLLASTPLKSMSSDKILYFDFVVCYGREFEIGDYNLHGDNSYKFSELALRKTKINDSIKDLVVKGYICVETINGFTYKISSKGIEYITSFEDEYTIEYEKFAEKAFEKYYDYSEKQLLSLINNKSFMSRR